MARRWAHDVGDWLASLRFSGFTILAVMLLVLGVVVISPTLSTYVQQQRELADLRASVQLHRDAVEEADAERLKWQDPAYVRSQARGRLFYVMPGEFQLSVISDVVIPPERDDETSEELTRIDRNWAESLVASVLVAGVTTASPVPATTEPGTASTEAGAAQPEPTPNPEETVQ